MPPSRLVIIGDPVAHSLSPKFQSAAIVAAGLSIAYEPLRVSAADLPNVAQRLLGERAGGNVTVPHKIAFRNLCGEVTSTAQKTGAVNTFWVHDGKLVGDNSDVAGFDAAARELIGNNPDSLNVALVGAGGAAAAVLAAVELWPHCKLSLFSRAEEKASKLASRFGGSARVVSTIQDALADADLVVNATPVGMSDDSTPFAIEELPNAAMVLDLVYRKGGTPLTRAAARAGHRAADGTTMLIEQGARSFERWFGFPPDKGVMRAALG